jgi:predicted acyl esterase
MYDHVVQSLFGVLATRVSNLELFVEAGFLVAAYNSRGAGQSGGHSTAPARTHMEDYESVIERLIKQAEEAKTTIDQLYICVCLL